ncbi:50S ribosomal protein L9 [Buchnera aphidicola (Eriosoma grossulariae)]|uniref:50S ribosomal protein L9 n=1 Tax=Buchnera aphidicola TaxID=9 RepID=UPI003464928B
MQIILLKKVDKLGQIGELIYVKSGYARNYLIPTGKAMIGNKKNIELFELKKTQMEAKKNHQLALSKQRAEKIIKIGLINILAKSGEEGKLFGSIGSRDIADHISSLGITVNKNEIKLPNGLLKNIGIHEIIFQPHFELLIPIKINIVS